MNNAICINHQTVAVKEYKGNRVVTLKDIDSVHGRPAGTARKRFNDNKTHFIVGEDYFVRNSDEAKTSYGIIAPNGLILITESGYLMLCKSFTDDLSWRVQRELVNNYFRKETDVEYHYFDKTYKGISVMTTADVAYFTGIKNHTVKYWVKHHGVECSDYFAVEGKALESFKMENPMVSRLIAAITLITKNGFVKLCKAYGVKVEAPKCFSEPKPVPTQPSVPKAPVREYALPFDTPEIQNLTALLQDELTTIKTLLVKLNRHNIEIGDFGNLQKTLGRLGVEICADLHRLEYAKPKTIDRIIN